jgi:hypothetical protein
LKSPADLRYYHVESVAYPNAVFCTGGCHFNVVASFQGQNNLTILRKVLQPSRQVCIYCTNGTKDMSLVSRLQLQAYSYKSTIKSTATSLQLQASSYKPTATSLQLQASSYKFTATSLLLQASSYKPPATSLLSTL